MEQAAAGLLQDFELRFRAEQRKSEHDGQENQVLWKDRTSLACKTSGASKQLTDSAASFNAVLQAHRARQSELKKLESQYDAVVAQTSVETARTRQSLDMLGGRLVQQRQSSAETCTALTGEIECAKQDISDSSDGRTDPTDLADARQANALKTYEMNKTIVQMQTELGQRREEKMRRSQELAKCRQNTVRPPPAPLFLRLHHHSTCRRVLRSAETSAAGTHVRAPESKRWSCLPQRNLRAEFEARMHIIHQVK